MIRKAPKTADRRVKPTHLPPEQTQQTDRIHRQIASLVNESMKDLQQQVAALVREQRRMAAVLEQMTRHIRPTDDETAAHTGNNRDEPELPLWIAGGITAGKASGRTNHPTPPPRMPPVPQDTTAPPKNIHGDPTTGKAPRGDALLSRGEEELPLDLVSTGWPRPAGKTRRDDSHNRKPASGMPDEAPLGSFQPKSEATQCPTAGGTTAQNPRPALSVAQGAGSDEPNMDTGEIPSGSPVFFPPKIDSRPAMGKFTWAMVSIFLIASAFWLVSQVRPALTGSTAGPGVTTAPAPSPSATFQPIALPAKKPFASLHPAPVPNAAMPPSGESPPDPSSRLSRATDRTGAERALSPPEADVPIGENKIALTARPNEAAFEASAGKGTIRHPRYPYAILIASVRTSAQANRAVVQYGRISPSPYWTEVDLGGDGIWYRIFSGLFETPEAARRMIKERGLADALTKHTPWVARVGTYSKETAETVSRRIVQETPWMPYNIDIGQGRASVNVGAFYTEAGARRQCDMLGARGIDCAVEKR